MSHRPRKPGAVGVAVAMGVACLTLGVLAAADRPIAWLRSGYGGLERDLNREAARGLRFAAASDGLPACSIVVMQGMERSGPAAEYRVVSDKDLAGALDGLLAQGFVPRGSSRGVGTRHEVIFERTTPVRPVGGWRLVEFEKVEDLQTALRDAAAEGYRASMLVRPAFRSWPGLSERGMVLTLKAPGAAPRDVQVFLATKKNVDDLAKDVASATSSGWQFDLLFAHTRDGGPKGRRERAAVVLSKARADAPPSVPVTIERQSSFGILGDVVVGAAAYWDEILVASVEAERRQAWASPVRLGAGDVDCGPLGFGFRFDAPRDQGWSVTGLVARPAVASGAYELLVVTDQDMNIR
ncbi:MAG: hypothetical protein R2708_24900 [Vicinamibacterales bacterium]